MAREDMFVCQSQKGDKDAHPYTVGPAIFLRDVAGTLKVVAASKGVQKEIRGLMALE